MIRRIVPWLAAAALVEWLIARTLTRSAIFMPKSPPVISAYQGLTLLGQLATTLTGLLALIALVWLIWEAVRVRRLFQGGCLIGLLGLSLIALIIPATHAASVVYHMLVVLVIADLGRQVWSQAAQRQVWRLAHMIPVLALLVAGIYQITEALPVFNLGEGLVVASGFAFYAAAHRSKTPLWVWLAAALPALAFSAMYLINPSITGIMAIWSTGLTLYLPWPLYAASLYLAGVAVVAALRTGDPAGWAILLLAAGGYPPQLSSHVILGMVALALLAAPAEGHEVELSLSADSLELLSTAAQQM